MHYISRDELAYLLGTSLAPTASPSEATTDAPPVASPHSQAASADTFTHLHAELGKVLPTLWARASESEGQQSPRERLLVLLRWWAGKRGYQLRERVPLAQGDRRRLDVVLSSDAARLALELDARFNSASLKKLQCAQRAGFAVLVVWTASATSREQAKGLRTKVAASLAVGNLHWLPMLHAKWGWV